MQRAAQQPAEAGGARKVGGQSLCGARAPQLGRCVRPAGGNAVRSLALVALLASLELQGVPLAAEEDGECKLTVAEFFQQLDTMTSWPAIYSVYKKNLPACP